MASLKGVGFVLGGLGLAMFVGGLLWALLSPPAATCKGLLPCERTEFAKLLRLIEIVWFVSLGFAAAGVVMLFVHLRDAKAREKREARKSQHRIRVHVAPPRTPPRAP